MVNHFLRNTVTVTLQWPREAGAVYSVNVLPVIEVTTATSHNSIVISLTISYDIQYQLNVSIASNLCDVTTTRLLKYGKSSNVNTY
jgi:creatinine amidohydrolase/Fe(II)-dependent formamide hydrolase-like protein